ncbi:N-ethylammeline chlorohydrolase [Halolamina pelagica]|uniref:N-ethylammeline chlorohydrolase n=1 Tax=Halolamina pelagica TaxID=699431 RepID=A0A0P7GQW6_9EURY|nr:amidohydrolase family protein [Halolamina pelagica]KPN31088.1 N-ethylammeline chlorohydrolase [Halolamina pelagica]
MTNEILLHDATVLTVDDRNRLFERGTVRIEDGEITEVRTSRDADRGADADQVIDAEGMLAMPGLVNAHTHLELTPLIGAFSDLELGEMMGSMTAIYERFAEGDLQYLADAGYELAALNFLLGGVTTVNSMDLRPAAGAEAFGDAGLRGFFGPAISDLFFDVPVDEQFARARAFVEEYHESYDGRIRATVCPHDDWSCSRDLWVRTADLAAEYPELLVHTHLLELDQSDTMGRANGADDSLDLLEEVGLLNERLLGAHYRVADDEDIRRTADAGASVAHCPSVFCYWNPDPEMQWTPVPELRDAGVDVGLGIDDHYWHDSYDLFGEARQARLAANLKRTAGQYDSMELVRMLTTEGARTLGIGDETGSIEPGKRADLVLLDVDTPKFTPLTNVPAQVVNNASAADVATVIVDGEFVLHDGEVLTMDAEAVRERATDAVDRFAAESGWEIGLGGADPPGARELFSDLPKRGPARLLSRLALQSLRER